MLYRHVIHDSYWQLFFDRKVLGILFVVATFVLIYASFVDGFQVVPAQVEGPTLVYYFVVGVLMFLWRDKFVFHEGIFFRFCWSMLYSDDVTEDGIYLSNLANLYNCFHRAFSISRDFL